MPKLSRTNVLTSLVVVAGLIATVGFVIGSTELGGAALGVGTILVAGLVHSVRREVRAEHAQLLADLGASPARLKQLDEGVQLLASKADLILADQRKSARDAAAQGSRTEAMHRRVIADIGAVRLELADRRDVAAD